MNSLHTSALSKPRPVLEASPDMSLLESDYANTTLSASNNKKSRLKSTILEY